MNRLVELQTIRPEDPLVDLGNLLKEDPQAYESTAREWTRTDAI